jgi:hypothetical protein
LCSSALVNQKPYDGAGHVIDNGANARIPDNVDESNHNRPLNIPWFPGSLGPGSFVHRRRTWPIDANIVDKFSSLQGSCVSAALAAPARNHVVIAQVLLSAPRLIAPQRASHG